MTNSSIATGIEESHNSSGWEIPKILRAVGAVALVISLSSFLFRGWDEAGDDVVRYLMLLSETLLIGIAGVLSIKLLQEPRGARTFFGLLILAIPVNFAIMGGLIYAPFLAASGVEQSIPDYLRWQGADMATVAMIAGASLTLLLPMVVVAYRIMARESSTALSTTFILANAMLLIPVREGMILNLMLIALSAIVLWRLHGMRKDFSLQTPMGRFARITLFIPLAVLFGRTMWIYGADALMFGVMSAAIYLTLRHISLYINIESGWRGFLNITATLPAASAIGCVGYLASTQIGLNDNVLMPMLALAFSGVLLETATRSKHAAGYRRVAFTITLGAAMLGMFTYESGFSTLWLIASGIGSIIYGAGKQQKAIFSMGVASVVTGLVYQLYSIFHNFDFSSWWALAIVGAVAIVVGSIVERHGGNLQARFSQNWTRFASWEY